MAEIQTGRGNEGAAPVATNAQQAALLSLVHTVLLVATSPGYSNASDTATTHWFTFISMVWGDPSPLYYPTDWVLACFVVWLSMVYVKADGSPLAAGSVKVYLYGVKKFYSLCNVVVDLKAAGSPMTNAVLGAIKKFSDPTKRVMPITAEMIYLIASLPLQGWDDEVFQLACLLGFFFLLRVGEFAETADYPSGGGGVRQLTMGDLEFFDANNNSITIESEADVTRAHWLHLKVKASKGDQMWLGCLRLAEATGRIDCVVQRAARFVLLAERRGQLHSEPLLQRSTGSVATDDWFRATLKAVIATLTINGARVDPAPFNTHSLRAGGATRLFELGKRPEFIAMMGRWASDAVLHYVRVADHALFAGVSSAMAY